MLVQVDTDLLFLNRTGDEINFLLHVYGPCMYVNITELDARVFRVRLSERGGIIEFGLLTGVCDG